MAVSRSLTRRLFCCAAGAGVAASLRAAEDEFQPLFDGSSLAGWQGDPFLWKAHEGEIVGATPGISYNDFLATKQRFGDFILRFQIRLAGDIGNSGVQFRSERLKGSMEMVGYQADVGPGWWGDLYDESRRRVTLVEADEAVTERLVRKDGWNEYEIHAEGPRIVLKINGRITAEYAEQDADIPAEGRIALQVHSSREPIEVRFKDLMIKEL